MHPQLYLLAARLYKPMPFKTLQLLLLLVTVVIAQVVDHAAAIKSVVNDVVVTVPDAVPVRETTSLRILY